MTSGEPVAAGEARRLLREAKGSPKPDAEDAVAQMVSGLIESRRFLSNILESSTEYSIIAKDLERRILSWNAGARRNYGYEPHEVLGKSSNMLHSTEDIESGLVDRMHAQALETGHAAGTFRRRRKDGSLFTASVVITRREEGGEPVGFLIISRDVTQEEELRRLAEERKRLLDNIMESSTEYSIIAQDLERRIVSWNAGAQRNYGYTAAEIIGRSSDILHDKGDLRSGIVARLHERALREGNAEGVFHRRRKDGSSFTASVVITPRRDADDNLIGYLVVSRDVTLEHELQRAVEEDRRRLAEADQRKDEFLATLAHELRNPLAPLTTAVQILQRKDAAEAVQQEAVGVVARQVEQMGRIVEDLLDIARISRGKITLRPEPMLLRDAIEAGVDVARPLIQQKRHHLSLEIEDESLTIRGDRTRLAQAIGNLVQNAAKYTPSGGRIVLRMRQEAGAALVEVEDNGYGLPKDRLDDVFGLFVQAHTHAGSGGLGLGLSLVKKVAEMHGGSVEAASEGADTGSRFTIRLPLKGEKPVREAALRVLVVDDNKDAADSVATLLRLEGMEAHVAYGGMEGLRAAGDFEPHAVVSDLGMPGVDGFELARRLRKKGFHGRLIALSGFAREGDRARADEAGYDAHLGKPPDMGRLLALVRGE